MSQCTIGMCVNIINIIVYIYIFHLQRHLDKWEFGGTEVTGHVISNLAGMVAAEGGGEGEKPEKTRGLSVQSRS